MTRDIAVWKFSSVVAEPEEICFAQSYPSLDQITRRLPKGAYTTLRTYHCNQALRLRDHLSRLKETIDLSQHEISPAELKNSWEQARSFLRVKFSAEPSMERRVRVIVDLSEEIGAVYVLIEPLTVPLPKMYQNGVKTITRKLHRQNPKAKLTNFVERSSAIRQELLPEINEVIMISDDGELLEGLSSNFFGVMDGTVFTAEQGVLDGITRKIVIEISRNLSIPLQMKAVRADRMESLDEAFITSASRSVLPVTAMDGRPVGDGRPGKITRRILDAYTAKVEAELEPI